MAAMRDPKPIEYPESDGQPMAETELHRDEMFELIDMLRRHFRGRDGVHVSGNMLLYYVEGDPKRCFAPDTFVAFGVRSGRRRIWKVWEEGKAPDVVFEVSSRKTASEDVGRKKALCARLGIAEYWLYDPEADYLDPPLQGYRLADGAYRAIPRDIRGGYVSTALGLRLTLEDGLIALHDVETGALVPRIEAHREQLEREIAEREAEVEERVAELAELGAEVAERDAEIARLRAAMRESGRD